MEIAFKKLGVCSKEKTTLSRIRNQAHVLFFQRMYGTFVRQPKLLLPLPAIQNARCLRKWLWVAIR